MPNKPKDALYGIMPENTPDLFIDIKMFEHYRRAAKSMWDKQGYEGLVLGLGKNVFVFDIDSCEFFEEGG